MNVNALVKSGEKLIVDNSSTILTAAGAVGTLAVSVLSFRAGAKVEMRIGAWAAENDVEKENFQEHVRENDLTWTVAKRTLLPELVVPAALTAFTIASIIMAHRLDAKKAAALVAAYGISQREFQDYKTKVQEKLTGPKEQAIRDEVQQDRVNGNLPDTQVVIVGSGEVLCFDSFTGRYFQSTVERIKQAENALNHEINHRLYASLRFFYDELGLPPTDAADILGWRNGDMPTVSISAVRTPDEKPCISFSFDMMPYPDYSNQSY